MKPFSPSARIGRAAARPILLLTLLCASACITWTPRSAKSSASATIIENMPMQKWGVESCGAGSLSTVLQHYGEKTSMRDWDASLPKMRGGVMTIDMLLAARSRGFDAKLVTGTPELVLDELQQKRPVILMLQVVDSPGHTYDFFHYVVVDGIDRERNLVRTQFGDGRGRWTTFDRLEHAWAGGGHAAIFIAPRDELTESLRLAVVLEEEGKFVEAAARYRTLVTKHPDSAIAWTNLGNTESQLGKRTEAEEAFRKALAIDSHSRDALNNLAWLLFTEKRIDEAEPFARQAVAIAGPDSYLMLDTLARILAAKGACDEASKTFRDAIDAVPPSRAEAKSDLEKAAKESCRAAV